MGVQYYYDRNQYQKSVEELAACVSAAKNQPYGEDLMVLIQMCADGIQQQKRTDEFIRKVSGYQLFTADRSIQYQKDLALLSLYLAKNDKLNAKQPLRKLRTTAMLLQT